MEREKKAFKNMVRQVDLGCESHDFNFCLIFVTICDFYGYRNIFKCCIYKNNFKEISEVRNFTCKWPNSGRPGRITTHLLWDKISVRPSQRGRVAPSKGVIAVI